jgi:hypothetical protein
MEIRWRRPLLPLLPRPVPPAIGGAGAINAEDLLFTEEKGAHSMVFYRVGLIYRANRPLTATDRVSGTSPAP